MHHAYNMLIFFSILGPVEMLTTEAENIHCRGPHALLYFRLLLHSLYVLFYAYALCFAQLATIYEQTGVTNTSHIQKINIVRILWSHSMLLLCTPCSHVWHIQKEKWKPTLLISFLLYCWHTSRRHPFCPTSLLHPPPNDCPSVSCCEMFAVDQDRTHTSRWGLQTQSVSKPSYCHWSRSK